MSAHHPSTYRLYVQPYLSVLYQRTYVCIRAPTYVSTAAHIHYDIPVYMRTHMRTDTRTQLVVGVQCGPCSTLGSSN